MSMKLLIEQNGKKQDVHLNETPIRVGRSPEFELCFNNPQVSRFHCIFWMEEGRLWVQDQGSANGTFVDDVRLESKIRLELKHGQDIKLGKSGIQISVIDKDLEKKSESKSKSVASHSNYEISSNSSTGHDQDSYAQNLISNAKSYLESNEPSVSTPTENQKGVYKSELKTNPEFVSHKQENFDRMKDEVAGFVNDAKGNAKALLENAQQEIDKLKQETQALCIDRLNQAEKEATQILGKAQKESLELVKKSKEEASQLLTEAQKKSFDIQKKSQEEYHQKQLELSALGNKSIKEAADKATQILEDTNKKISQLLADSQNEAVKIKSLANKESEEILSKANQQAREVYAKAQDETKKHIEEAHRKSEEKIKWAQLEAEKMLEEGRGSIREMRENAEKELAQIREQERQRVLADANDDVKKMFEKAQLTIDGWIQKAKSDEKEIRDQIQGHQIELETLKNLMQDLNESKKRSQAEIHSLNEEAIQLKKDLDQELSQLKSETQIWCEEQKAQANKYYDQQHKAGDEYLESAQKAEERNKKYELQLEEKLNATQVLQEQLTTKNQSADAALHEAKSSLDSAKKQAAEMKHQADEELHKAQKHVKELRDKVELEATEKRKQMEESAVKSRIQAEEDLTQWLQEEQGKILELRRQQVVEFEKNVLGSLLQVIPKSENHKTVELEKSIRDTAKKSFVEVSHELLTAKRGRNKKRRWIINSVSAACLVLAAFYGGSRWEYQKHEVQTQANYLLKKIQEQREKAPKFNPKMDYNPKSNYADNIIHTKEYATIKLNESVKDQWITSLNKLFLEELELKDETIVKFITMENNLIRDLVDLRKGIIPEKEAEGLQRLKEAEDKFVQEVAEVIGGQKNISKINAFEQKFLQSYLSTAESMDTEKRGLASTALDAKSEEPKPTETKVMEPKPTDNSDKDSTK